MGQVAQMQMIPRVASVALISASMTLGEQARLSARRRRLLDSWNA
jgi:hypothetical protein